MELILKALVPVAFIIMMGWIAGNRKIIDPKYSSNFATYMLNFSFPSLLLFKTATSHVEALVNYRFMGGFALGLLGMYALVFMVNRYVYHRPVNHSCQSALMCSFPNMAFMGIPVFMVLFGEESIVSIVIGNIITSLIMIPVTVTILELSQDSGVKTSIWDMMFKLLTNPLVLAPMLGVTISIFNLNLPTLLVDSLKLFGYTTPGVSLFALGLIMSANKIHFDRYILANIFCKNFLHPLMMYGIVLAFGISGNWAKEAILLSALPSAITATMFAVKYDVIKVESSSSAVIGTVISLVSLALIMHLLGISA